MSAGGPGLPFDQAIRKQEQNQQQASGAARVAPGPTERSEFARGYDVAVERLLDLAHTMENFNEHAARHFTGAAALLRKWGPEPTYWEQDNPQTCPLCGEPSADGRVHAACADREAGR